MGQGFCRSITSSRLYILWLYQVYRDLLAIYFGLHELFHLFVILNGFSPVRSRNFYSFGRSSVGDPTKSAHWLENLEYELVFRPQDNETGPELTAGSIRFLSSLIASSLTQNLVPSIIARTPVFFPGVALLSNSFVLSNLPSIEKMDSFTLLAFTVLHGAGVNPLRLHSLSPYGALIDVALAASMKCSEIMFIVHSFDSFKFRKESLALSNPPAYPTVNSGGSWLMT